jgi:single-strand DNA-binding protein
MQDINQLTLCGRLTRDAEVKYTSGGLAIAEFSIACNVNKKVDGEWQDVASFFDCTYFGKGAEAVQKYLVKGKQIVLAGHIEQQRWERDGQKRSKVAVIIDRLQLMSDGNREPGKQPPRQVEPDSDNTNGADDHFNDDIPF